MKRILILLASVVCTLSAMANEADDIAYVLQKHPALTADELKKVIFQGSMGNAVLNWELHNPFRDKEITGFVVSVAYEKDGIEKPLAVTIELFVPVCGGPLQSALGDHPCVSVPDDASITLKEVHFRSVEVK